MMCGCGKHSSVFRDEIPHAARKAVWRALENALYLCEACEAQLAVAIPTPRVNPAPASLLVMPESDAVKRAALDVGDALA